MMSKIIKEKSIPFNLKQSKIILQKADLYYEKLLTNLPSKATSASQPKIFHTLYDLGNTTLIVITFSNTGNGSSQKSPTDQYLKLFDNALLNAINEFQLNSFSKNNQKINESVANEETVPKKELLNNYHSQKKHSPLLDTIMYELEDFAYMFPVLAFVIGVLGVSELFSEPFSFGTIRDVFIAGIFVYGLMKASYKIIDYNFIPPENASVNTEDRDSELSENTDNIGVYIVADAITNDKENCDDSLQDEVESFIVADLVTRDESKNV